MESQKKKIILIDDNEVVRLMFSNFFWLHNLEGSYELTAVSRIEEAFVFIANPATRPDIVITGLVMPFEKNGKTETSAEAGFALIRHVKNNPATQSIRVIVFSSHDGGEYKEQALSFGAEAYLQKGDNMPQDLVNVLGSFEKNGA